MGLCAGKGVCGVEKWRVWAKSVLFCKYTTMNVKKQTL